MYIYTVSVFSLKIYARVKDKESKQEIMNGMDGILHAKKY